MVMTTIMTTIMMVVTVVMMRMMPPPSAPAFVTPPLSSPSPPFPNPPPPPTTFAATVRVDTSRPSARSGGRSYVSFNLDWHCGDADAAEYHCRAEPGWDRSSVNLGLDLTDPHLIEAARQLAPGRLRVGGSQADFVCYDTTPGSCQANIDAKTEAGIPLGVADSVAFILNMTRWEQIVDFCRAAGVQLVFGLNGETRPDGYTALDWTVNNTEAFVRHVATNNAEHIFAFELGNELCGRIMPKVYAEDMKRLKNIIDAYWPGNRTKPLVIGPDCNPLQGYWINQFINQTSDGILDVLTYHNYVGYGLDPQLAPKMMSSDWNFFDAGPEHAKDFINGWKTYGQRFGMEIWAGEIAAAWHSGEPGVTDRFISSFWYADALGLLASLNHTGFCRQTMRGGDYGLLDRTTGIPNPDYYIAQLFHDLMGRNVLSVSTGGALDKGLRAYAQCYEPGEGAGETNGQSTLLFINVSPSITFDLTLPGGSDAARGANTLELRVYQVSADDGQKAQWNGLDSKIIRLNGQAMDRAVAAPLPAPSKVSLAPGQPFRVPPLTISFVVLPEGFAEACY